MRKKIIYGFISVLGLVFLFFIGFKYGEYEEKKQIERVKMEEQQDAEAAKIAERYVEKYSDSLQKSMAIAPLTDLKVEYQKLTWSEYQYGESCSNKEETEPYDFAEEWAEEFGDGDYDDGYDDAYDYWESERD